MTQKKKEIPMPLALKGGQKTLFGDRAAHCPLTKEEKRIEKLITLICLDKLVMRRTLENDDIDPKLSINAVLDRFLDARVMIVEKLRELGYIYTRDEEDHPHYKELTKKMKKPRTARLAIKIDDAPF